MEEEKAYLQSLESELKQHKQLLKESAEAVLKDEITNFPIFVFHKLEFNIGEPLLVSQEEETEWNITMVTLEQLIQIGFIPLEKAKLFISSYKDPERYVCVLAIENPKQTSFVYYPY
jgi:hypothetical protein